MDRLGSVRHQVVVTPQVDQLSCSKLLMIEGERGSRGAGNGTNPNDSRSVGRGIRVMLRSLRIGHGMSEISTDLSLHLMDLPDDES